ncbi:MAG: hypothetical protein N3D18_05040 [Roseococcus sp.]|nr:hypothetical protein [Roseococcus sp.]
MAIPDFQTLMLPVLQELTEGPVRASELIGRMAAAFRLTDEERARLLPSGRQAVINNRVHWALT